MKAKVVKGINTQNIEEDVWMIMIQKEKGKRYNIGLLDDTGRKPYFTYHKDEANEKCKKINTQFAADGA